MLNIAPRVLAYQLAFFAGFLLYLGASDLLPQVHTRPKRVLIVSTLAGLATAGLLVFMLSRVH
jgi:zinc transporter ZupT